MPVPGGGAAPRGVGDQPDEDWLIAHADFHTALLAGRANARLRELAASLRESNDAAVVDLGDHGTVACHSRRKPWSGPGKSGRRPVPARR